MALINSFNKTSLDLQSPDPNGGPINDTINSGFQHKNLPTDPNTHYKNVVTLTRSPLGAPVIFERTNLDLESPRALGGPINDRDSKFKHTYTPANTYINNRPR